MNLANRIKIVDFTNCLSKLNAICIFNRNGRNYSISNDLMMYDSFKKKQHEVKINEKSLSFQNGCNSISTATAYICGPTVYDHSHLGHAITYLRFDLIRRALKYHCSVDLLTVMNITDVDDKIIAKAHKLKKSCTETSDFYLKSFNDDLKSLNIAPVDLTIRVTEQIESICNYISKIEKNKCAYWNSETGDLCIQVDKLKDYPKRTELDESKAKGKLQSQDFVLWKVAKPNEPSWTYESPSGKKTQGRPGWHVECSAIANGAFGPKVDFHFGGQDLLFPHHLNESACCSLYQNSFTDSLHNWVGTWIHFGQFIYKDEKMSKSLGNTISIKQFLTSHSKNLLRIMCLNVPYKRDIYYKESFINKCVTIEHKISQFTSLLNQELIRRSQKPFSKNECSYLNDLLIESSKEMNLAIANDMNFSSSFATVLDLITKLNDKLENLNILDLLKLKRFVFDYLTAVGLNNESDSIAQMQQSKAIEKFIQFRGDIRKIAIKEIKSKKSSEMPQILLKKCDQIRNEIMRENVFIVDKSVS